MKDKIPQWFIALVLVVCGFLLEEGIRHVENDISELQQGQEQIIKDVSALKTSVEFLKGKK